MLLNSLLETSCKGTESKPLFLENDLLTAATAYLYALIYFIVHHSKYSERVCLISSVNAISNVMLYLCIIIT